MDGTLPRLGSVKCTQNQFNDSGENIKECTWTEHYVKTSLMYTKQVVWTSVRKTSLMTVEKTSRNVHGRNIMYCAVLCCTGLVLFCESYE